MSDIPNYGAGFQNPMQNFMGAIQTGSMMANAGAAAEEARARLEAARLKAESDRMAIEAAAEKERQKQALMSKINDPNYKATYNDYQNLSMFLDKDASESVRVAADNMNKDQKAAALIDTGQIFTALRSGSYKLAADLMRAQGEAELASGNKKGADTASLYASFIEEGPEKARLVENLFGAQIEAMGTEGKAFFDSLSGLETERRTAELFPTTKAQAEADLEYTKAQTAKLKNERPDGVKVDASGEALINTSVTKALDADKAAIQSDNLADAFDKLRPPSGWGANFLEQLKKAAGGEDRLTALKQEYIKLRNTDALKNLPPGAASDKDIEAAMAAFPSETSNPDLIASFMRGTAKLQRYAASMEKAKADWINQNGSLASARSDFTVNGEPVKAGTAFWDFTKGIAIPNVVGGKTAPAPKLTPAPANEPVQKTVRGDR